MQPLIFSSLIITIAFFGESIFGFGGGLIAVPLLSILLGVRTAVTVVLMFQLCMGLLIVGCYKHINWKLLLPMTVALIVGTVIGTYILSVVSDSFLRIFLAVSILLFLTKTFFFKGLNFIKHNEKLWGNVAGLLGGLFQGIIGTGGPILTMFLSVASPKKSEFRAALILLFFVTSIVRIIISLASGLITPIVLSLVLPALPFFLLAIFLGHYVHKKIGEQYYRYAVYIILFFSAISMLIKH